MASQKLLLQSFASIAIACSWGLVHSSVPMVAQGAQNRSSVNPASVVTGVMADTLLVAQGAENNNGDLPTQGWAWEPPPEQDAPGRRDGAGTRGECPMVVSLIPSTGAGGTSLSKPTLLYYVNSHLNHQVELVLTNENHQETITKFWLKTDQSGIVRLPLNKISNLPSLEVDQYYQWDLTIWCSSPGNESPNFEGAINPLNSVDNSNAILVSGWIKRVALSSEEMQRLESASALDQLKIYTQEFLWYDSLAILAQLRIANLTNPNLSNQWQQMLTSVKLDNLALEPLVEPEILMMPSE